MLFGRLAPVVGNAAESTDDYFENVSLLLQGDGTNGVQNNTFVDGSPNNFSITRNGNTTQGTFTPYGSNWSNYFDGSSYLSASSSAGLSGSGSFTLEAWIFPTIVSGQDNCIYETRGGSGWVFFLTSSAYLQVFDSVGSLQTASSSTVTLNQWNHVALVKNGSTCTYYINGTASGTFTLSSFAAASGVRIGARNDASQNFRGYISNIRTVTSAVYTGAFTPSTTPLTAITNTSLLTCQSNCFIDNSSNAFAITVSGSPSVQRFSPFNPSSSYSPTTIGGSAYFDGTGDYLYTGDNAVFNVSSGNNFTLEGWCYPISFNGAYVFLYGSTVWAYAADIAIYVDENGGSINISSGTSATTYTASFPSAMKLNSWNHWALVRSNSGTTLTAYLNGVGGTGVSAPGTIYPWLNRADLASPIYFGTNSNTRNWTGGTTTYTQMYSSDVRFVNGTALYTSNFSVPSEPLTAVANTVYLAKMANAGIYDNAMMNDLETVGNVQVSTSEKKYGTGSIAFDGSGDALKLSSPFTNVNFGSGEFTIEAWIYVSVGSRLNMIYGDCDGSTNNGSYTFNLTSSNKLSLFQYTSGTNGVSYTTSASVPTGQWVHVSANKTGTTLYLSINGTVETFTGLAASAINNPSQPSVGSQGGYLAADRDFNGYIDDLRITKGVARYTSNFTPATAALPKK